MGFYGPYYTDFFFKTNKDGSDNGTIGEDNELIDIDEPPECAYSVCANHNLELCLKDGFKKVKKFNKILKKVAKFVVKCRSSTILATELQEIKKTLQKNNQTRWNSWQILLKSFNKLTDTEYNNLISKLKMSDQSALKLNLYQRALCVELEKLLTDFLYISKKFQSNEVTSSIVYPAISYLKSNLVKDINQFKHTKEIRQELVKSLSDRFNNQLNCEVFLFATFLDPHYGPNTLPKETRDKVIACLVENIVKNHFEFIPGNLSKFYLIDLNIKLTI